MKANTSSTKAKAFQLTVTVAAMTEAGKMIGRRQVKAEWRDGAFWALTPAVIRIRETAVVTRLVVIFPGAFGRVQLQTFGPVILNTGTAFPQRVRRGDTITGTSTGLPLVTLHTFKG